MLSLEYVSLTGKTTNIQNSEWRKELENMLQIVKNVYLEGSSVTENGVEIEHYSASLNGTENGAGQPTYNGYISDPVKYRQNRAECIQDRIAFEDAMYELWDEITTETSKY